MSRTIAVMSLVLTSALITFSQTVGSDRFLTGTVCDPNHAAVHDAEVSVRSASFSKTARTDENGSFSFSLPRGDYLVSVVAEGLEVTTKRVRVTDRATERSDITFPGAGSTEWVTIVC